MSAKKEKDIDLSTILVDSDHHGWPEVYIYFKEKKMLPLTVVMAYFGKIYLYASGVVHNCASIICHCHLATLSNYQ